MPLQMTATNTTAGTLTWTATGLPAGLTISTSGLITGTPTTVGSYTPTVTATSSSGPSGSTSFTWAVSAPLFYGMAVLEADTNAKLDAVYAAGGRIAIIQTFWDREQASAGAALDATAVATRNSLFDYAIGKGMQVILRVGTQYPPAWVLSGVPKFADQNAATWDSTNPGEQVRDWVFSAVGAGYLHDYATKAVASLGSTRLGQLLTVQTGLGFYGETQMPRVGTTAPYSWWAYSAAAQGTGRASDIPAVPTAGYKPFLTAAVGTVGTTADLAFVAWYRQAVRIRMNSLDAAARAGGWSGPTQVLHPSFGVRSNWTSADAGWREQNAQGVDYTDQISQYGNAQMYPWATNVGSGDAFSPPSVDSDHSQAWKIAQVAATYGRTAYMGGENTGGGTTTDQDRLFTDLHSLGYRMGADAFYSTLTAGTGGTIANFTTNIGRYP